MKELAVHGKNNQIASFPHHARERSERSIALSMTEQKLSLHDEHNHDASSKILYSPPVASNGIA